MEVVTAGIDEMLQVPYLVMELLKGEELKDMIDREGPVSLEDTAEILSQAGHALQSAHAKGIVHRDLKPENMFIAASRREGVPFTVKILDFGIAKLVAERTQEGTQPVGTPLFMSPEQTDRRGLISPATDVWPLGLIGFYMLTGTHYWLCGDGGITQLLREVVMEPIVPPSERATQLSCADRIPVGFDAWFLRCVDRDPRKRFADGGEACRAFLEQVAGGKKTSGATVISSGAGVSAMAATAMGAPLEVAGTTQGQTVDASTGGGSKLPIVLGVGALVVAGGAFVAMSGSETPPAPAASASAPVTATAAASAAAPVGCPEGMVKVDGGKMFMGSADKDLPGTARPPHPVTVSTFCLDTKEVTVAQYQACSKKGTASAPTAASTSPACRRRRRRSTRRSATRGRTTRATTPSTAWTGRRRAGSAARRVADSPTGARACPPRRSGSTRRAARCRAPTPGATARPTRSTSTRAAPSASSGTANAS